MVIVQEQNTSSPQLAESIIFEKFNNLRTDEVYSRQVLYNLITDEGHFSKVLDGSASVT